MSELMPCFQSHLNRRLNYDEVCADYCSGMFMADVARKHGVGVSHIRKVLIVRHIPLRGPERLKGSMSPFWKGGTSHDKDGYCVVSSGQGRSKKVHRIVASESIGRELEMWEAVHHKDGNKANNLPDNLIVMPMREHNRWHTFCRHHAISHSVDMLMYCRPQSPNYYRFTVADKCLAEMVAPPIVLRPKHKKRCRVVGCGSPLYGKGYCSKHWQRLKAKKRGFWISGGGEITRFRANWKKFNPKVREDAVCTVPKTN